MVLGRSEAFLPVNQPLQLTAQNALTWDDVRGSSLPIRLNHWYWNMQVAQGPADRLRCLVSSETEAIDYPRLTIPTLFPEKHVHRDEARLRIHSNRR